MALKLLLVSLSSIASWIDVVSADVNHVVSADVNQPTMDEVSNVQLKIQGQSGRFSVYATVAGESDPNKIVVLMDSLTEVDSAGNAVGASGNLNQRHSIQTFAPQDFTIQEPVADKIGNVSTRKIAFSSTVGEIGEIGVDTIIVLGQGVVGPASEAWEVRPGDLKWNIQFPSWKFCGDQVQCKQGSTQEVGAFLDLDITVKGSAAEAVKDAGGKEKYALGGGVDLLLTNTVTIDGEAATMPEGYPKVEMKGGKQVFKFRFPKFSASATYDPVLTTSKSESMPAFEDTCSSLLHPGLWSLIAVGFMKLLAP